MTEQPEAYELFNSLLNLSGVKVVGIIDSPTKNKITIQLESIQGPINCRQCGQPTKPHGSARTVTLRHLSLFGKETYIEITPRRGRCDDCDGGVSTNETFDWYDPRSKMTKPYEQYLLFQLINSTVADVSRKEGVDYRGIENLLDRHIEDEVDYSSILALGVLGLDEISLKKGYRDFVTLITYRIDNQVHILGIVKGREKADIQAFLKEIPSRLKKTVQAVCCDLYEGYINAAKSVFKKKVPVVADRFHVKKLYHKALVTLRKAELKRLKKSLSAEEYAELKPAIAILRKQRDYFIEDEKELVNTLFSLSPKLKEAYAFSRALSGMFDSDITADEAKDKIADWVSNVEASDLKCFDTFIKTLSKYTNEISHYFISRNSSGFVEGFNNKVKVLKRRCYGLSNIARLFKRLVLDTEGLNRYAPGMHAI